MAISDLQEALERLRELARAEEALRMEARKLGEERTEVVRKLEQRKEGLEDYTLSGLREPFPEDVERIRGLESRLKEVSGRLSEISQELDRIPEERVEILKDTLPRAWQRAKKARARVFDPKLRTKILRELREILSPFYEAQRELEVAERELEALLEHSARVHSRAPSVLRQELARREGPLPNAPEDQGWRVIRRIATAIGEVK